jgi:DNA-binding transcriptional MerR regulator
MAENLDNPSFGGNFGIQDTMEMGMGNAELLNDLLGPDTTTSSPDDLQEIVKEVEDPAPAKTKPAAAKTIGDDIVEKSTDKSNEEKKQDLTDFLLGDPEDEEEQDDDAPAAKPAEKAESEEDDVEDVVASTKFEALANDLFNLGVFTKEDDDDEEPINTPEEFLERFQAEKKKGAIEVVNNFIGQFGEDYQQAFDAIFVKGVDPKEYFGTYNNIANFSDMDLSQEGNQIAVIKQALQDQGFDPEDVETEVERLKNYGDLESVATKHHKVLVKKEAQKLAQLEQKAELELQQKSAIKNQYIQNVQTILGEKLKAKEFDGIPLNPKIAGELQDFLLVDKYKTNSGETLTDFDRTILELKRPENHAMKVKLGLLLKILEKDPTLSTIQKTGVTKKSNELFGQVARQVEKSATKGNKSSGNPTSWFQ